MKPEEMRAKSSEKVKQVMDLMKTLSLRMEPREFVNGEGFIINSVFWIDDEKYPQEASGQMDISSTEPASPTSVDKTPDNA